MRPEVIKQEDGKFALLKQGQHYYASVVCGTAARYVLNIPITAEQADEVISDDQLLDQLVGEIAYAPTRYLGQHVALDD
jgi:hypothetical protein